VNVQSVAFLLKCEKSWNEICGHMPLAQSFSHSCETGFYGFIYLFCDVTAYLSLMRTHQSIDCREFSHLSERETKISIVFPQFSTTFE
jgi:hypothetical protein